MRAIYLLLSAAGALALPSPVSSPSVSMSASVNVLAEQTVFQQPATTENAETPTSEAKVTTTSRTRSKASSSASDTVPSPSSDSPSPSPDTPSSSPASPSPSPDSPSIPLPSLTNPNPNPNVDPATPTNSTDVPMSSVTPQSIGPSSTGIPGLEVVTEVVTVTASAGGADNGAKVYFPNALNYWVLYALSVIEWAPALPVAVDIRLTHTDPDILLYDYLLSMNVPAGFSSLALSVMEPAKPGTGYQLVVADHDNGTIYSTSEMFEIKKEGSSVLVPAGFAAATQSGSIAVQASGARRLTWSAALALGLATLWL